MAKDKPKLMLPVDLARILGNTLTGPEPQILFHVASQRGQLLSGGPYERCEANLDTGLVTLFHQSSLIWELAARLMQNLFERVATPPIPKIPPILR